MDTTNKRVSSRTSVWKFLLAGLIAGIVGGLISFGYYLIFQAVSGSSYAELTIFTIIGTGIFVSLIGSLVYYGLSRRTNRAVSLFWAIGLAVAVLSTIPNFVAPPNPAAGFAAAASPMHLIIGIVCLLIVPAVVKDNH